MKALCTRPIAMFLPVALFGLFTSACDNSSGPVTEPLPQGKWVRTITMPDGTEHLSRIQLARDSAVIHDSVFSFPGGVRTLDSTHEASLELSPSGDGYLLAVEEHSFNGSEVVERDLRYWYFFVRDQHLYFYRGMRFRGSGTNVVGEWAMSSADSAFLGWSYGYAFSDNSVTITRRGTAGTVTNTYPYDTDKDTLEIEGGNLPAFGDRFEIVPGLALYITTHREEGYERVGS